MIASINGLTHHSIVNVDSMPFVVWRHRTGAHEDVRLYPVRRGADNRFFMHSKVPPLAACEDGLRPLDLDAGVPGIIDGSAPLFTLDSVEVTPDKF